MILLQTLACADGKASHLAGTSAFALAHLHSCCRSPNHLDAAVHKAGASLSVPRERRSSQAVLRGCRGLAVGSHSQALRIITEPGEMMKEYHTSFAGGRMFSPSNIDGPIRVHFGREMSKTALDPARIIFEF